MTVQHLIDPESCVRCEICAYACASSAILVRNDRLVVDPHRCDGARACLDLCPTGAIANWIELAGRAPYEVEAQAEWEALPPGTAAGDDGSRFGPSDLASFVGCH